MSKKATKVKKVKLSSVKGREDLFLNGIGYADVIVDLQMKNIKKQNDIELLDRKIKEYEDSMLYNVLKATDNEGKLKYKNDTTRKLAQKNLLRDSQEYNQAREDRSEAKFCIKTNMALIEHRRFKIGLIKAFLHSFAH